MAAGLPGFGLSGVFFVVSALLMVPIELVSTIRGRSSLARWGVVLRSAGIALAILAGLELTYAALHLAVTLLAGPATAAHGSLAQRGGRPVHAVHTIPMLPILGTLGLVALVTGCGKAAEMLSGLRRRPAGVDSATPAAELPSFGQHRLRTRVDGEPGAAQAVDGKTQPSLVRQPRVAHELQPALEVVGWRDGS